MHLMFPRRMTSGMWAPRKVHPCPNRRSRRRPYASHFHEHVLSVTLRGRL